MKYLKTYEKTNYNINDYVKIEVYNYDKLLDTYGYTTNNVKITGKSKNLHTFRYVGVDPNEKNHYFNENNIKDLLNKKEIEEFKRNVETKKYNL